MVRLLNAFLRKLKSPSDTASDLLLIRRQADVRRMNSISIKLPGGLTLHLESRFFVAVGTCLLLYIACGETGNQWVYLLFASLITAILLGVFLPLLQVLSLEAKLDVPPNAAANEAVVLKLTLARLVKLGPLSSIFPFKCLLIKIETKKVDSEETPSLVMPLILDSSEDEIYLNLTTVPLTRGVYQFKAVKLSSCFPFGLAWWTCKLPLTEDGALRSGLTSFFRQTYTTTVYPRSHTLTGNFVYRLEASSKALGMSVSNSTLVTQSSAVRGLRDYVNGDSLSTIHWASSARTGRLLTRQFDCEGLPGFDILLDLKATWWNQEEFELAIVFAASLIQLGYRLGASPELILNPDPFLKRDGLGSCRKKDVVFVTTLMSDLPALPPGITLNCEILARVKPTSDFGETLLKKQSPGNSPEEREKMLDINVSGNRPLLAIRPAPLSTRLKARAQDRIVPQLVELSLLSVFNPESDTYRKTTSFSDRHFADDLLFQSRGKDKSDSSRWGTTIEVGNVSILTVENEEEIRNL